MHYLENAINSTYYDPPNLGFQIKMRPTPHFCSIAPTPSSTIRDLRVEKRKYHLPFRNFNKYQSKTTFSRFLLSS